jgi:hypothetical protein
MRAAVLLCPAGRRGRPNRSAYGGALLTPKSKPAPALLKRVGKCERSPWPSPESGVLVAAQHPPTADSCTHLIPDLHRNPE